ncbi:magnesium transporter [Ephemerocybe angulata]|uniref:Magnesium transporter n=1 Tax=Ephemerocybe angulata TaxID=980116 RepID=A0A8H6M6R3_9AGAR|nr:magnesium transporter [Tulosesus angulatus]
MPRTNSLSDSDGRSLTPDLEDEGVIGASPTYGAHHPSPFGGAHHGHALTNIISRKSHHTHKTHKTIESKAPMVSPSLWKNLTPLERFRAAGRKVIAMSRGATLLGEVRQIGAEPGIDPRRESANIIYGQVHKECKIEIIDYSAVRCNYKIMSNDEFVNLLDGEDTWKPQPWVKCRWINIGGVSWDVIKALAYRYSLHPLALEDVFNKDTRSRSKADYYSKHLFIRVMCHELGLPDDYPAAITDELRSSSPEPLADEEPEKDGEDQEGPEFDGDTLRASVSKTKQSTKRRRPLLPRTFADLPSRNDTAQSRLANLIKQDQDLRAGRNERKANEAIVDNLKKGHQRVNVKVKPMYIFLYRDGTVITIHRSTDLELTAPISQRLRQRDTVLRTSIDHSLLVHALLDITVDKALEVIDEYHAKISNFERRILLRPDMKTVKELHILSGDLILHKRTLDPIKTMIFGLRRYDVDRCAALIDMSDPANEGIKVVGYMSHKAKIYLADVYDHMDYILTSLDMFAGIGENLIDYTFNLASYEMNEVMRRLTLATIIFLPLTLLTGYFGMNFNWMWSVQKNSDVLFWIIALPLMAIVIPMFMMDDIKRGIHYIGKRMTASKAAKSIKMA